MSTSSSRVTDNSSSASSFSGAPQGRALSERKLNANRQNAQKSTGPKTKEGKAIVSQNATTHGIHCQHLVLPCENKDLFHHFRTSYLHDLHPKTTTELLLVDRIVSASWKLRRLQAAEYHLHVSTSEEIHEHMRELQDEYQQAKEERDDYVATYGEEDAPTLPEPPPHLDENTPPPPGITLARLLANADDRSLDRLHQHEQRLERSIHRSLKELRDLRKSRPSTEDYPDHPFLDDDTYNTLHPTTPRNQQEQQEPQIDEFKPTEDPTPTPPHPDTPTPSPTPAIKNDENKPTVSPQSRIANPPIRNSENRHSAFPPLP